MPKSPKKKHLKLKQTTIVMLIDPGIASISEKFVRRSLSKLAKRVVVHTYSSLEPLLRIIKKTKADLVFNYTQEAIDDRRKDAYICAALDLCGIPYSGAGPRGLIVCRDKAVSKVIAAQEGFRSPAFFVVQSTAPRLPAEIAFPLVVKPRFGDGSEGISRGSLVHTRKALLRRIAVLRRAKVDDVICEEFIGGREMIVAFVGRRVVPPKEFIVGRKGPGAPVLATAKFKDDAAYRRRWSVRADLAKLTASQFSRLSELVLNAARALEMGDYGRFDVRLTASGEWAFLEANPNPGLMPFGKSFAGTWGGVPYDSIIAEIAQRPLDRGPPRT